MGAAAVAVAGTAAPSWAMGSEAVDAQLVLARIFPTLGGKFEKERNLVMPVPEEDGFTDSQVATCLVIALLMGLAAWDLAKALYKGLQPDPTRKNKGSVTPLVKRLIEK